MSFESQETSLADGRPLRLYRFTRGAIAWCYASGDRPVTQSTQVYQNVTGGIIDDGIRQTGQASPDQLTITAPASLEVAQLYRAAPPSEEVALTIFSRHIGADDFMVSWSGSISAVRWPALDRAEIVCAPLSSRMSMTGLRLTWDRACPHALYSASCGVSDALWRIPATVDVMDGQTVNCPEASGYPDGYFTGGLIDWQTAYGAIERRAIQSHVGTALALLGGTAGLVALQSARLYPGCGQTTTRCKQFNNLPNFGGIPHLPGKSPFDGNNYF